MNDLHEDMLQGADAISEFMFGDASKRRRVYWLAERGNLPVFRLGNCLCARRSKILEYIESQEAANVTS